MRYISRVGDPLRMDRLVENRTRRMTKNRQVIADFSLRSRSRDFSLASTMRAWARHIAFQYPPIRRYLEPKKTVQETAARWNALMSETNHETYLGGTVNVDSCNAMTATLIKYRASATPSVLDIGCSGGTLLNYLPSYERYLGLDISDYAVNEALDDIEIRPHVQSGRASFAAIDLRQFSSAEKWDVIVINEVLYYLSCDEAVAEFKRYGEYLAAGGVLVVTMKDDAKISGHICWFEPDV
jgi:SAM-dependent methyltransferase